MSKAAVFPMKIEPELRDAFMAEAEASHRPASQVVRELMRGYVDEQREKRSYREFLQRKVDIARGSIRRGEGIPDEVVEAEFAERRRRMLDRS